MIYRLERRSKTIRIQARDEVVVAGIHVMVLNEKGGD